VHAPCAQDAVLGLPEVVAGRSDDAHVGEERGGQREVHGGAAEHALALAEGCRDRVEGDRSNDGDAHGTREPSGGGALNGTRSTAAVGSSMRARTEVKAWLWRLECASPWRPNRPSGRAGQG